MLAERYPLSLHGVSMGLGNTDPVDDGHLRRLRRLADQVQPALISEHLCWNAHGGSHFNGLLSLPYTEEAVAHVVERIGRVQEIHLAGHTRREFEDMTVLRIETHDQPVCAEIRTFYRDILVLVGARPILIECDADLPPLAVLDDPECVAPLGISDDRLSALRRIAIYRNSVLRRLRRWACTI
ncbi:hypothetical protein BI364_08225 [Acidihalobacter yilgarnensis]|uniref:DUF692 domain-containing protein n=1 Tax=Acidihalobacter yilgarnensis TaxID=2819280 RepID=A0A1D8INA5_9GAMM|nr:hypothetical protein BI364_08225 [Acidihalobacter yilgarnensis]